MVGTHFQLNAAVEIGRDPASYRARRPRGRVPQSGDPIWRLRALYFSELSGMRKQGEIVVLV